MTRPPSDDRPAGASPEFGAPEPMPPQPEDTGGRPPARRPMFGPFTGGGVQTSGTSDRMPIAALVLGIVSIPFALLTGLLGIVCGVLAIILGLIGIRQVRNGTATKSAYAIAGVVTGVIGLIAAIVVLAISVHRINDCKKHIGHTPSQQELTQCARDHI